MNVAVILLRFSMEIYGSYWKMRDKFEVLKFWANGKYWKSSFFLLMLMVLFLVSDIGVLYMRWIYCDF